MLVCRFIEVRKRAKRRDTSVKRLFLSSVAVLFLATEAAYAADEEPPPEAPAPVPSIRVTPLPIPPLGWVYNYYAPCADPQCRTVVVNVDAAGLNVRTAPNGYPVMSLVNGTPLIPLDKQGDWLLVAAGCDLTPTFAWSWTAGVPLNRCWVYF
jgi:hypothetical protein